MHLHLPGNSLYLVDFEKKFIDGAMEERSKRLKKEAKFACITAVAEVDTTPAYVEDLSSIPDEEQW